MRRGVFHVFALDARHLTALFGHCDLMQSIGGLIGDPAVLSLYCKCELTERRRVIKQNPPRLLRAGCLDALVRTRNLSVFFHSVNTFYINPRD